jgi:uncharacterized protein (DUF2235 family)
VARTTEPKTKASVAAKQPKPKYVAPLAAPRNLVIMLDGTGNELGRNLSNVLKLYRIAEKNAEQLCYYNPGVGTISRASAWSRFSQKSRAVLGLMTGYGLDENVLGAYKFLVENWREGDHVYMFGFSRGAWTVRVLAGFVHLIGLLKPEQANMCDSALGAYKRAASDNDLPLAWHFRRVIGARQMPIHFVGVWDSVASVIVPRADRFWIPSFETLPYTKNNPSVGIFRHALALDERRSMFRVAPWADPQIYKPNPFHEASHKPQDIKQVWFPGVHSDIGGGYPEEESALSKIPLIWMVEEAKAAGLRINTSMFNHLARGKPRKGSDHVYVAPNPAGLMHQSLSGAWWMLEGIPKSVKSLEWKRRALFGLYIPHSEPRAVPPETHLHISVAEREATLSDYRPVNALRARSA